MTNECLSLNSFLIFLLNYGSFIHRNIPLQQESNRYKIGIWPWPDGAAQPRSLTYWPCVKSAAFPLCCDLGR